MLIDRICTNHALLSSPLYGSSDEKTKTDNINTCVVNNDLDVWYVGELRLDTLCEDLKIAVE
jgi:hypothetical protein